MSFKLSQRLLVAQVPPPPTTIPVASGLQLWLDAQDASTFTYSGGTTVSTWADKSGLSRTGVAIGTVTRNTAINGYTACAFPNNGGLNYIASPVGVIAQPLTVMAVAQWDNTNRADGNMLIQSHNTDALQTYTVGSALRLWGGSAQANGPSAANATPYVVQATPNGTSTTLRLNGGTSPVGSTAVGTASYNGARIGGGYLAANSMTGRIGEVALWNRALTLGEINTVGAWLAARWGITWTTAT